MHMSDTVQVGERVIRRGVRLARRYVYDSTSGERGVYAMALPYSQLDMYDPQKVLSRFRSVREIVDKTPVFPLDPVQSHSAGKRDSAVNDELRETGSSQQGPRTLLPLFVRMTECWVGLLDRHTTHGAPWRTFLVPCVAVLAICGVGFALASSTFGGFATALTAAILCRFAQPYVRAARPTLDQFMPLLREVETQLNKYDATGLPTDRLSDEVLQSLYADRERIVKDKETPLSLRELEVSIGFEKHSNESLARLASALSGMLDSVGRLHSAISKRRKEGKQEGA